MKPLSTIIEQANSWYLAGDGGQPAGPFTAEELIVSVGARRIAAKTPCWREGLAEWLPLERVEPFASAFRRARMRMRRRIVVYALGGVLVGLCAGLGVVARQAYRAEAATLAEVRDFVADGKYQEVTSVLTPFLESTRFHRNEAECLLASTKLRQYATSANEPAAADALDEEAERLHRLFDSSPRWRERARQDLAGLMDGIPPDAPDALARSTALTEMLEELGLPDVATPPKWLEREKQFFASREKATEALGKRDFPGAVAWLNDALKLKPDDEDTEQRLQDATAEIVRQKLAQAEQMVSDGDNAGARVLIAEVEKLNPLSHEASVLRRRIDGLVQVASLKKRAAAALEGRNYEAALALLREAVQITRDDDEVLSLGRQARSGLIEEKMTAARRFVSERRYAEAQATLNDVLSMESTNAAARELLGKVEGLVQFADLRQAGAAALEQGDDERALTLLGKASDANPNDNEVKSLARKAKTAIVRSWIAATEQPMAQRKYLEAQQLLGEATALDPGNLEVEDLVKRIAALQNNPETTDLTGVWVTEHTHNRFQLTVEGDRIRIEGVPSPEMTLSGGKKVSDVTGAWQREGNRLSGDLVVVFRDSERAVVEVSAAVTSAAILRVRWKDAKWDAARKKWIGWGYSDWRKEAGGSESLDDSMEDQPTGLGRPLPRSRPGSRPAVELPRYQPDESKRPGLR